MSTNRIRITDIIVGERFRKEYGDVEDLASSIARFGLLHPIVIDANNNLCAGGRRLAAINHLGWVDIPYTRLEELDELTKREIELEENLKRKDLTWQEEVALTKAVDDLKKAQYGDFEKDHKRSGWSKRKTAKFLNQSASQVASDIELAEALEVIPELASAKTKSEAQKNFNKLMEDLAVKELLKRKAASELKPTEQQAFSAAEEHYIVGDCIVGLRELEDNDPSLVIAEVDTPYAVNLPANRKSATARDYNEIDREDFPAFLHTVAAEVYRVLAPDSWCVWWFGQSWQNLVYNVLQHVGFAVDEIPAVWVKNNGQTNAPDRYFARAWEPFFLCRKGKPVMAKQGRLNVFSYTGVASQRRIHPTERPLDLILDILDTLVHPGIGRVLVPCLGSGNTLRAAYKHGMSGIGWDLDGDRLGYKTKFIARLLDDKKEG